MNDAQRKLLIASLIIVGLVLAYIMLDWRTQWGGSFSIVVLYEAQNPTYASLVDRWGIYTNGVIGVLLGVVAPLCLFALAAYMALGARRL